MKVILDIKDEKAAFFFELLKSLSFVKNAEPVVSGKNKLKSEIKAAVDEIRLAKKGKKKLKSFDRFLDEL